MSLYQRLRRAAQSARLAVGRSGGPVSEHDVAALPAAARRYLQFRGVVGRERDWSFRARFRGEFRRRPGGPWIPADAWQFNASNPVSRIFVMRLRVGHVVPMVGYDTYLHGAGRMVGSLFGLKVVDASGNEFDHSELVIYLNDAVLLAPSMLLGPEVTWAEIDDHAFEVALTDHGRTVTARVLIDERGVPVDFIADRYATLPDGIVKAPWRTPIEGWERVDDRWLPGPASVEYELPDGPFCYARGRFVPSTVVYNLDASRL